jgi:hypothetical protein
MDELRVLIGAKAARIHRLATANEGMPVDRLSMETAELQAMIAEAVREQRLAACHDAPARFARLG